MNKVLIDIGHPAHVHLFRNFIKEYKDGCIVTVKDIPSAKDLLKLYGIEYFELGNKKDSLLGKLQKQFSYNYEVLKIVKKEKIRFGMGTSITIPHVSKFSSMSSIVFDDDDDKVQPFFTYFAHPFTDTLLSPEALKGTRRKKDTIFYAGYHELAYLHPNRFTPDPKVLMESGIQENEKFYILRFNSFKAHHDIGVKGLSIENKRKLISELKKHGKILITTEREMDDEFKQYQIKVPQDRIHSLIYYSSMLIGDSQTMTSEAAVLGTPALRCNTFAGRISYLQEEEDKYKLTFGFLPENFEKMFVLMKELLNRSDLKEEWNKRRMKLLSEKIDVTSFMLWFINNYPDSKKIMKREPEYQYNFR
ncbi:DUF354 domain-containing protein [soil metagenome]